MEFDAFDLLIVMAGLVVLLIIMILVFLAFKAKKPQQQKSEQSKERLIDYTFDDIRKIVRSKSSTQKEMKEALDYLIAHFGTIEPKLGMRSHPDFDRYAEVLYYLCRHVNATKELVIGFDSALSKKNPQYRQQIDEILSKGLNARGGF